MRHLYSEGQSIRPGLPWKLSKQRIRLQSRIKTQDLIPGLGRCSEEGNGYPLSILAWEIPWTEEAGGLQSMRSRKTWTVGLSMCVHACTHVHTHTHTQTQYQARNLALMEVPSWGNKIKEKGVSTFPHTSEYHFLAEFSLLKLPSIIEGAEIITGKEPVLKSGVFSKLLHPFRISVCNY